jgi:RNA-directed DNA polymerase
MPGSRELVERWQRYVRGWCNYFRLAEARWAIAPLEKWTRRHMRKCFWLRWHDANGRRHALRRLGAAPYHLATASASCGAWRMARSGTLNTVLSTRVLRRYGLWTPSDLWAAS